MAASVLALAETVELDLRLMVGNKGILDAPYPVPLLIDSVEQVEGVAGRIKLIKVILVSDLASEVLVSTPQDVG